MNIRRSCLKPLRALTSAFTGVVHSMLSFKQGMSQVRLCPSNVVGESEATKEDDSKSASDYTVKVQESKF